MFYFATFESSIVNIITNKNDTIIGMERTTSALCNKINKSIGTTIEPIKDK